MNRKISDQAGSDLLTELRIRVEAVEKGCTGKSDFSSLAARVEVIEKAYVSRSEITPIKTFVYGIVSMSLVGIMAGVIKMVLM